MPGASVSARLKHEIRGNKLKWTLSTGDFVRIALFAAIIAALGLTPPITLAFLGGVPVTAQTLGVMLAGVVLGARLGVLSVSLLIFVVLLGAPVLSGQRGGLGVLFGPSAGFFLGWIPAVITVGWLYRVLPISSVFTRAIVASIVGGIVVLYIFGIPVMAWRAGFSFDKAFFASMTFVPGDVIKAVAVGFIAQMLEKRNAPAEDEEEL